MKQSNTCNRDFSNYNSQNTKFESREHVTQFLECHCTYRYTHRIIIEPCSGTYVSFSSASSSISAVRLSWMISIESAGTDIVLHVEDFTFSTVNIMCPNFFLTFTYCFVPKSPFLVLSNVQTVRNNVKIQHTTFEQKR